MVHPLLIALGVGVGAYLLLKPKGPAASPPGTLQVPPTTIYGSPSASPSVDYGTGPDIGGGDIQAHTAPGSGDQAATYTSAAPIGETLGQPVYPDTTQTSGLAEVAAVEAMVGGESAEQTMVGSEPADTALLAAAQAGAAPHHYQAAGGWPHLGGRRRTR